LSFTADFKFVIRNHSAGDWHSRHGGTWSSCSTSPAEINVSYTAAQNYRYWIVLHS